MQLHAGQLTRIELAPVLGSAAVRARSAARVQIQPLHDGDHLRVLDEIHRHQDRARDREIEIAMSQTLSAPESQLDHLCCGNLGRAEVLMAAGIRLGQPATTLSGGEAQRERP